MKTIPDSIDVPSRTDAPRGDHERRTMVTRLVGIGSPHGNDQIGWLVTSRMANLPDPRVEVVSIPEPSLLWHHLDRCDKLILVDAVVTGAPRGSIIRLEWPDPRIAIVRSVSSHGIGLAAILQLAEKLDRLPATVVLFGLELGERRPEPLARFDLETSCTELEGQIDREIEVPWKAPFLEGSV